MCAAEKELLLAAGKAHLELMEQGRRLYLKARALSLAQVGALVVAGRVEYRGCTKQPQTRCFMQSWLGLRALTSLASRNRGVSASMLDDKPRSHGLAETVGQSSGIGRLLYMLTFVCKPPNSACLRSAPGCTHSTSWSSAPCASSEREPIRDWTATLWSCSGRCSR